MSKRANKASRKAQTTAAAQHAQAQQSKLVRDIVNQLHIGQAATMTRGTDTIDTTTSTTAEAGEQS